MENLLKQTQDPLFSQIINQKHLADKILGYVYEGKHGLTETPVVHGRLLKRNWKEGKLHGIAKEWHPDGKQDSFEGNYKHGKLDGIQRWRYENGQLASERNYKEGAPDGVQKEWYRNGQLKRETRWEEGRIVHEKTWLDNGHRVKVVTPNYNYLF